MYYRLHPVVLLPLNFWSTAIYVIWERNDVALSHSCAFSRQLTACRSFRYFLANIARLPHHCLSSFFSSISMTYHKQFQISQPCARSLCGELCSWLYGWIRNDGCRSDRFVMHTDRSSDDPYDITHWNFVSTFRHEYCFCFVTYVSLAEENRTWWPSYSPIWILELSHGVFDPCTCTDELSYLTILSLKSSKSRHVAKLVNNLLFTEIRRQKLQFAPLFFCRRRSYHHLFVRIRYLYGN